MNEKGGNMHLTKTQAIEKTIVRVCAYVRVSTKKEEQHYSFINQSDYWQKKLGENEDFKYVGLFSDEGISGKMMKNRNGLNEMLEKVRRGEIDRIYTKSISRFARNYTDALTVVRELRDLGIPIIFEKEGINTLDPKCGLLLSVMASLAEEELKSMSKNQQWAVRKRFANGSVELARIYGYKYEKGKLIVKPKEAELVKKVFQFYLEGNGVVKVARLMDESGYKPMNGGERWGKSTIIDILRNEKYIGDSILQKNIYNLKTKKPNRGELPQYYVEGTHEAIISKEDFMEVQKRMKETSKKFHHRTTHPKYPLSGKIRCGNCGTTFSRKIYAKGKTYECIRWSCRLKDQKNKAACGSNDIKDEVITKLLIEAYNESLDKAYKNRTSICTKEQLQKLLEAERELKALYAKGYISENRYRMETGILIENIKDIEDKLKVTQKDNTETKKYIKSAEFTRDMADFLIKATVQDWTVKFEFANGYVVTKKYTNGRAGNVNGKLCKHKT